ncbi:glycosyl hydrolase family 38 protein [Catonella morbi ATCC 51271]|uniref:Glycosyl hydrolase family 38 protein n=1 Tax=Catonella morbi ATCC 51271 TaxID=592026 RepID=V2XQM6_9FIRM|nr:glycoside hydrolase family 38 C-terminal domain-containing protein [Catonella morbi]ESL04504.1 glycosyl hydrolase family 38 protein [Catonella morbi ATCC 51271]
MPFDFKHEERIYNLLEEIRDNRYKNLIPIEEFDWYEDDGEIGNREPVGTPVKVGVGFSSKGYDKYNWLCTKISIPVTMGEENVLAIFDFGVPMETGNTSNFESLLYVNGKPYQGVDGNHKEVFFNLKETGRELDLKFRLWSGLSGGGRPKHMTMTIERAEFGILDTAADDFYYLAMTALQTQNLLEANNEYKPYILNQLVEAFRLIDFTCTGSENYFKSLKTALDYLREKFTGQGKPDVHVTMLGHTHIDVAWLWRVKHSREKSARSFSTVNRLMEKYPEYVFIQTQPQLYDYIKEDYPDIYEHIQRRVEEGRWEPSGAMWVECDCNLTSGESIIRQILVGKNFFKKEFDFDSEFLWLPDVFGYSWALPQILKKSGVNTFMTTKISWNDTNRLPYDTFIWRGMDGSEITTHFITTTELNDTSYTYNGDSKPFAIKGVWDNYRNKDLNRDLIISYGWGDGGGGPTREMIKYIEAAKLMPGLPKVDTGRATEYFRKLNNTVKENPYNGYIPVWDGELYLEFHRGTYTSQGYNKKMNRFMEYKLREQEMLSVFAEKLCSVTYNREELLKAWKIVLCEQFHDILPGSSIHEVYEDSHLEYERALSYIDNVKETSTSAFVTNKNNVFTLFNQANWERDTIVKIPAGDTSYEYKDSNGNILPCHKSGENDLVYANKLKPVSFTVISRNVIDNKASQEVFTEDSIETPFYIVAWDKQGRLVRLYDKSAEREVIPEGKSANVFQIFEDKPRCFDAWELESTIDLKKEEIFCDGNIIKTKNELGYFVHFTYNYNDSKIIQTMCLYNHKRRIDFKTVVEWKERQKILKTAFSVDIRGVFARYDIQEGNIVRPITRNTSWEAAKFEVVAHKWAELSETGYGVALLNDCKYGYDIKEDTIRLSLLKSATDPDYNADYGTHEFTYSLYPHKEEWYESGLQEEAFDLNSPVTVFEGETGFSDNSLISFDKPNIVVDALKKAENEEAFILRFHEFTGRRNEINIDTKLNFNSWCEADLMENPIEAWKTLPVKVKVKPYEIKTIMFK